MLSKVLLARLQKTRGNCRFWPIHVELIPETGWHLYALKSDATTAVGQGKPSIISVVPNDEIQVCDIVAGQPLLATNPELRAAGAVEGPIAFTLQVETSKDDSPKTIKADRFLEVIVGYQTCSDITCDPLGPLVYALIYRTTKQIRPHLRFQIAGMGKHLRNQ